MNEKEELCLQTGKSDTVKVEVAACDINNPHQKWAFTHYSNDYDDIIRGSSQYKSLMISLKKYKGILT